MVLASTPGCQGEDPPGAMPEASTGSVAQALTCVNVLPIMTSATAPAGSVTRSGAYSAEYEAWKAFDSPSSTSMWISALNQTPAWIAYQMPTGSATIHRYAITFHNGPTLTTRGPKEWTLQGWNGSSWVVVDTRTNQTNWAGYERREFTLAAPATYSQFRLNVTDDNDTRAGVVVVSMRQLELIHCANDGTSNPVTALWTRTAGAAGYWTQVQDLVGDPAGRSYVTGITTGGLLGNAMVGPMDAFLHARDWNGNVLWSKQIGVPGGVTLGYDIARNSTWEELFVGGFTSGALDGTPVVGERDAFLTKYRYTGVRQWTRQVGGAGVITEGYGAAVDGLGNSFLAGSANGGVDGNTRIGNYDAFVTKFDTAGVKQWTRQTGRLNVTTHARRVAADAAGNVYVSGWTTGGLDGNTLSGSQDAFVVKYDAAGVKQWTRQLGSAGNTVWLYGSATDAAGNVYLTGYSGGGLGGNTNGTPGADAFLAKYDGAGTLLWTRELGSMGWVWGAGLHIDDTGVYLTGHGQGDVGNPANPTFSVAHAFVAKFNTAGTRQWVVQQNAAIRAGAPSPVYSNGVNLDEYGNIYLGGYFTGTFDGNAQAGDPDSFVSKLAAQ
nr:SBBP repeat-containing protein [Corallococcus carmarthensis]